MTITHSSKSSYTFNRMNAGWSDLYSHSIRRNRPGQISQRAKSGSKRDSWTPLLCGTARWLGIIAHHRMWNCPLIWLRASRSPRSISIKWAIPQYRAWRLARSLWSLLNIRWEETKYLKHDWEVPFIDYLRLISDFIIQHFMVHLKTNMVPLRFRTFSMILHVPWGYAVQLVQR